MSLKNSIAHRAKLGKSSSHVWEPPRGTHKISGISQLSHVFWVNQRVYCPWKVFHERYALEKWFTIVIFLTIISQLLIHYHDINRFTIIFLIHHDLFTLHYQCFTSIQIVVNNYYLYVSPLVIHHISYSPYIYLTLLIFTHERTRVKHLPTVDLVSPRNSSILAASTAPQPVPHSWGVLRISA